MKPAIILRKLMLLLAMLSAWPALSAVDYFMVDGIAYHITDASKAEVEVNLKLYYTGNIIIPKEVVYDSITYSVTAIGGMAFYQSYDLTSIEIPESVTSIGEKAFYQCFSLTSIEIPESVISIGSEAFRGCSGLTSIKIPGSVTSVGNSTFSGCSNIGTVIFEDGENDLNLYSEAFNSCQLEEGYLGRNIFNYQNKAISPFQGHKTLKNVIIGNRVTSIADYAFQDCSGLTSINIPGSVTSIGNYAFSGCSGLTSIKNMDGVSSIADYAFQDCSGLTSINIPGSVTSIGNYAFSGCSNLTSIAFEDGESELVDYSKTYDDHTAYSYVYLGRILTSPANFPGQNIQTFEFGENISSIQKALFQGRTVCDMILSSGMQSINSEDLPAGLESICLKSGTYNPVPTSFRGELRGINPETTLEMASNPDFDPFGRLTYKEDNKYYSILIWNRPIDATGAYYINDAGALIPENQPCTLRTHYSDGCILHNGEDVTDRVTSDEGYTLTPSSARYRDKILTIDSTNLRNVTLQNAGSLFNELGLDQIQAAEGLVITGNINGTDVMTLNRMPKLKYLDLTDANIVNGGMTYRDNLKTSDNTIGSYFFNSLSNLVVLKLPKSITTIEDNAFNGCSSLASLTIPGNCVSMGKSLFTGCEKLYKITFEKGESNLNASGDLCGVNTYEVYLSRNIVNGRFTNSLRKLVIGDGASALDNYIIYPCKNITELIIENGPFLSMTRLINFPSCQLKTVYIGRGIDISFASFNSIESVRINNGSIPSKCFSSNKSLKTVEISGECTIGSYAFNGCSALKELSISGNGVIENSCFYGCTLLDNINFCGIGKYSFRYDAFDACESQRNVAIDDLTAWCKLNFSTGSNPLAYNANLILNGETVTDLVIPETIDKINGYAFYGSTIKTLIVNDNIKSIGSYAFSESKLLQSAKLSNNIANIGACAFMNCSALASVNIPDALQTIINHTFYKCSSLTEVKIPETVHSIGISAFYECSNLTEIKIPDNVEIIDKNAFYGCSGASSIIFGNKVETIGESAFQNCSKVSELNIPESVVSMGKNVFNSCSSLLKISLPQSITAIPEGAFMNCQALHEIAIPNSILTIGDNAFNGCGSVISINIPDKVTTIGQSAFYSCSSLEKVVFGKALESIGSQAFRSCSSLQSVNIPDNVTTIGREAFQDCTALTDAVLSNGIREIVDMTFAGCTALESVLIGKNTTKISDTAFQNCTNINKIRSLNPTPPVISSKVFKSVNKETCQLVVTKGNLVYYWLDPVWKEFLNMNDNMLALNPLPAMRYGDEPVDLSAYAPEGVTLSYESSDNSVARLDGSTLSIVGAGEATIGASYPEAGTPMEIIGQMRQLIIDKADLDVALEQEVYEIMQGEAFPAFGLTCSGLCYDDSASDIDELPSIVCEAENTATPGEYAINLEGGNDRNYNFHTKAARLIIHESSGVENVSSDNDVRCYGLNGRLTVEGAPVNAIVNIYRFDGSLCHSAKSDGTAMTFEVANNGFYIVIVNGKPYRLKI